MPYNFTKLKSRGEEIKDWFKKEIASLRTGQASPLLLDNIFVESYGTRTPLKHTANISVEDARTLRVTPWDAGLIQEIEKAIISSSLGIQPIVDKATVRIVLPELTEERRNSLVKILSEKLEKAKISVRQERDEVWRDIQDKEKNGEIPEDDKFIFKDQMQEIVDKITSDLEEVSKNKKEEIAR